MFKLSEEDATMLDITHGLELEIRDRLKGKRHQPVISHGPSRIVLDWKDDTVTVIVKMEEAKFVLETTKRKILSNGRPRQHSDHPRPDRDHQEGPIMSAPNDEIRLSIAAKIEEHIVEVSGKTVTDLGGGRQSHPCQDRPVRAAPGLRRRSEDQPQSGVEGSDHQGQRLSRLDPA